jgi:uncharacterized membrane protein YphA (DoxX/SURF4 family)
MIVSWFMLAGRTLEFVGGFALAFGFFPRLAAFALFAFLIPPTLVSHSLNLAILCRLLFIGATATQPVLTGSKKR